jgi:hypothetical protein
MRGPVWSRDLIESAGRKKALGPETHEESQGHPRLPDHYWHPALFAEKSVIRSTIGYLLWTAQPLIERESKGWTPNSRLIEVIKVRRPVP